MIFAMRTLALSATALLLGACADVRAFVEEGRQPSTIARGAAPARDVAGAPAPHGIAERIYTQATQTQMAVRYFKGEPLEKTLAWAEGELEGFMRN